MLIITTQEGDRREVLSQSQLQTLIAKLEGRVHITNADKVDIDTILRKLHRLVTRS